MAWDVARVLFYFGGFVSGGARKEASLLQGGGALLSEFLGFGFCPGPHLGFGPLVAAAMLLEFSVWRCIAHGV
jgi:hypothetical protein